MNDGSVRFGDLSNESREEEASGRPDAPLPTLPASSPRGHETDGPDDPAAAPNWETSLHFVRTVAERVREAQHQSSVATGEAQQAARDATVAMWAAQERALKAEADAVAALARAEEAEDQLRLLRSQIEADEPAVSSVDRWLNEAYQQLRMASEKRPDPAGP